MYLLKLNGNELKLNEKVRNSALLIGLFPSYFPFFFLLPRYVGPPGRVLLAKRDRSARSPHCLEIRGGRDRRRYTLQPSPIPSLLLPFVPIIFARFASLSLLILCLFFCVPACVRTTRLSVLPLYAIYSLRAGTRREFHLDIAAESLMLSRILSVFL